jgi:alkylation response protein AidB-like acyl-CoA dehydrogenase
MFLAPDGDEIELMDMVAGYLAESMPISRLHAPDPADMRADLRKTLGSMGWFGLALAEDKGGSGLSAVEYTLFFREVGRQCGPVDLLAQCLATFACKDDSLRAGLLAGEEAVALAVQDGAALRLLGAADAKYALYASPDETKLFAIEGKAGTPRPALSPANSMRLLDAELNVIAIEQTAEIYQMGELGTAAMLLGLAEAALDLIVDYAKIRETFGRKIGAYQAVRHPCADMALRAETARCQLWYAAAAIKEGRTDAGMHLDAAKHLCNQAGLMNAESNIQLHGGIGVTDEHNAHLFLKQAMLLGRLFGSKRALLSRLLGAKVLD